MAVKRAVEIITGGFFYHQNTKARSCLEIGFLVSSCLGGSLPLEIEMGRIMGTRGTRPSELRAGHPRPSIFLFVSFASFAVKFFR
jgi:hypothetical protein